MRKIRMNSSRYMCEDGRVVQLFERDKEYEVTETCASHAVSMGWATIVSQADALFNCFQSPDINEQLKALNNMGEWP